MFAILLFCSTAQNKYHITNYTTKNGLPENNLQSLQLDSAGFLWISYSNGLLRFDGFKFRNFTTSSVPYSSFMINKTSQNELLACDVSGTVFEIKNQKILSLRKGAGKFNKLFYSQRNSPQIILLKCNYSSF